MISMHDLIIAYFSSFCMLKCHTRNCVNLFMRCVFCSFNDNEIGLVLVAIGFKYLNSICSVCLNSLNLLLFLVSQAVGFTF